MAMKKYLNKNVYTALKERIHYLFDEFQAVYVSFSGGKDSSVLLQIVNKIAAERHRSFDVFFFDFEAQYSATIDHINELKKLPQIGKFYHFCLPLENED